MHTGTNDLNKFASTVFFHWHHFLAGEFLLDICTDDANSLKLTKLLHFHNDYL